MGLLDNLSDPTVSAGLLGLGAGLLSGSTGHYGAFAPALGQGFAGMQVAQNNERQLQQQGVLRGLQAMQLKLALQKQGLINRAWGNTLGVPATAPTVPAPGFSAPTIPSTPSSGVPSSPQSSAQPFPVEPSGQQAPAQASTGSFAATTPTQSSAAPAPAQSSGGFKMPIIPGMSAQDSFFAFQTMGPAEYMKMAMGQTGTDLQKTLAAAGVKPGTPEYQQAMMDAIAKANYIPPTNIRAGGFTQDASGHVQQFPQVPEGYTAQRDQSGQWHIVPVAGASDAIQGSAAAKAKGQAAGKLAPTQYDAQGHPLPTTSVAGVLNNNQTTGDLVTQQTKAAGVPDNYARAVLSTESGGNPNAVSFKGATGAMQVMPSTAANPGFGVTPAQNNSAGESSRVGVDYLGAMLKKYKDPTLAAIAYNMGPVATDAWLKAGGDYNKLPPETKNYVSSVMTKAAVNSRAPQSFSAPPFGTAEQANAAAKITGTNQGKIQSGDMLRQAVKEGAQVDAGVASLQRMKDSVDIILKSPGFNGITGLSWDHMIESNIPGTQAADAAAQLDTLKSQVAQNVLQMYREMSKTGGAVGQVSDFEQKMFQNYLAALSTSQSPEAMRESLKRISDFVDGSVGRLKKAYDSQYGPGTFDKYQSGNLTITGQPVARGETPAGQPKTPDKPSGASGFKILSVR